MLTGTLIKIITVHSSVHICVLGEHACEECWSISELPTFSYWLKLLGRSGWFLQLNTSNNEPVRLAGG
jgi:hypothetical protein